MKILHVCLTGGYTEGFTYQENYLSKYHALDGHDVTILTTEYCWNHNKWRKCKEIDYWNKDNVHIIRLPYKVKLPYKINSYVGKFQGLDKLLNNIKPNLIFIHNLQFRDIKLINSYKKAHKNTRILADSHTDFSNSARNWLSKYILYKFYWKKYATIANHCVEKFYGVLPARVDFLRNIYKLPANKCELLVMGADDEEVKNASKKERLEETRRKFGYTTDDFVIVTGGKIDIWKKQTLLLMQAIKKINNDKLKLLIFGPVSDNIKNEFNSLVDAKQIIHIDWANSTQSYEYFAIANLVVFPGRHSVYWEQAAGQGKPLICKYWEGTTHIDLGGNVIFLMEDSVEEMVCQIKKVINDKEKFKLMEKIAFEKGMQTFSYKKISAKSIK